MFISCPEAICMHTKFTICSPFDAMFFLIHASTLCMFFLVLFKKLVIESTYGMANYGSKIFQKLSNQKKKRIQFCNKPY